MSETKHTKGPWKVVPPGHGHPTEYLCVELDAEQMYATVEMLPADAHLIAAAPDLLAALEEIVARNEIQHWFNLDQARAAIAKAKGEK